MVTREDPTVLRLSGIGVPPWSARGLKEDLSPISQASQNMRDANGDLHDTSFEGFQKYSVSITGSDHSPPNVDGKWPGQTVTVDCISELSYTTIGGTPARAVVSGSSRVEGLYTIYRPQLVCKVISFKLSLDEYDRQLGWNMELEET